MALKQKAKSPSTEETGTAQRVVHGRLLKGLGLDREALPRAVLQGGLHLHSVVSRFSQELQAGIAATDLNIFI